MKDDDVSEDRRAILARRTRFIVSAISSLSLVAVSACGEPQACLEFAGGNGQGGEGGTGGDGGEGGVGGPQACLSPPLGGGGFGGDASGGASSGGGGAGGGGSDAGGGAGP